MNKTDYKIKVRFILSFLAISTFAISQESKTLDCFIDGNRNIKYCIMSDSKTHDEHFGICYRLFKIESIKSDSVFGEFYLDVNRSPDFPYQLITDFYDKYDILIIKGVASFYLYSPKTNTISDNIYPDYTDCEFSDGQGSFIDKIKILDMGKTLELRVMECGTHNFDIEDINNIKERIDL